MKKAYHLYDKIIFDDIQVEILKKIKYKIEFFVSRDIPTGNGWTLPAN